MASTTSTALKGRLAVYDCPNLDRIDQRLREIAADRRCIRRPTEVQRADYWADVDALLERRAELTS